MDWFNHNQLKLHVQRDLLKDGELISKVVASSASGNQINGKSLIEVSFIILLWCCLTRKFIMYVIYVPE